MRSEAEINIFFDSEDETKSTMIALKQEEEFKKRSTSKIIRNGNKLTIRIDASDIVALRATLNSYLRDVQVIENIEKNEED